MALARYQHLKCIECGYGGHGHAIERSGHGMSILSCRITLARWRKKYYGIYEEYILDGHCALCPWHYDTAKMHLASFDGNRVVLPVRGAQDLKCIHCGCGGAGTFVQMVIMSFDITESEWQRHYTGAFREYVLHGKCALCPAHVEEASFHGAYFLQQAEYKAAALVDLKCLQCGCGGKGAGMSMTVLRCDIKRSTWAKYYEGAFDEYILDGNCAFCPRHRGNAIEHGAHFSLDAQILPKRVQDLKCIDCGCGGPGCDEEMTVMVCNISKQRGKQNYVGAFDEYVLQGRCVMCPRDVHKASLHDIRLYNPPRRVEDLKCMECGCGGPGSGVYMTPFPCTINAKQWRKHFIGAYQEYVCARQYVFCLQHLQSEDAGSRVQTISKANVIALSPADICFTHNSISAVFSCGRQVRSTLRQLERGEIEVDALPTMIVTMFEGRYWAYTGNRPLWIFKALHNQRVLDEVHVRVTNRRIPSHKMTTSNDGAHVYIRERR